MGINGRAGTGDRGVDWLAGPSAHTATALHTASTAVYSQHKLLRPCPRALHQLMCISVLRVCCGDLYMSACVCVCVDYVTCGTCVYLHEALVYAVCVRM